jgi:hypothetical protein
LRVCRTAARSPGAGGKKVKILITKWAQMIDCEQQKSWAAAGGRLPTGRCCLFSHFIGLNSFVRRPHVTFRCTAAAGPHSLRIGPPLFSSRLVANAAPPLPACTTPRTTTTLAHHLMALD